MDVSGKGKNWPSSTISCRKKRRGLSEQGREANGETTRTEPRRITKFAGTSTGGRG